MRKRVGLGLVVLLIAGTALAQDVKVDYNHHAPFKDYRTYTWIRTPQMTDPIMVHRVQEAIDNKLQSMGLQEVNGGNADIGIVANGSTHERHTLNTFYDGFDGWGWGGWGAPGMSTTEESSYPVGTLVVDIFDARTKQIVWRGIAKDTLSDKPEKNTEKLDKAVDKLFDHFPK